MANEYSPGRQDSHWRSFDEFIQGTGHELPLLDSERWVSFSLDELWPDWQERAHCRSVGYEYYFGNDDRQPAMSIKQIRRASKLCDVCPVYVECLTSALVNREEYGVWAGTSRRVRRRIFQLIDMGLTTVDEVVERFLNGQGDYYRTKLQEGAGRPNGDRACGDERGASLQVASAG